MSLKKTILLTLTLWIAAGNLVFPQQVLPEARMDTSAIRIGEQTHIHLTISFPAKDTVVFPEIGDTLIKEVEIVQKSRIDTSYDEEDIFIKTLTQTLTITSFDTGYFAIPPFRFTINDDTILSEALLLEVHHVLIDEEADIKDIKSPLEVKFSWIAWLKDHWHLIAGVFLLLALIIILIYFLKRKKPEKKIKLNLPPPRPAHEISLEKLELLKQKKLWQQGEVKLYHIELSEILREYLELRYAINALEQTTEEIMRNLRTVKMEEESRSKLRQTLVLSDLVKFAKEQPVPSENERCMNEAFYIIEGTKQVSVITKNTEPGPGGSNEDVK